MNGLPVAFYTYQGTQTGEHDPWTAPEPVKQARKPKQPKPQPKPRQPPVCGTYAKYREHYRRGEKCGPCAQAKRAYDRKRYQTQKPTRKPKQRGRPQLTPEQTQQTKNRRKERELARRADPTWRAKEAEQARARYANPEYRAKRQAQERARYKRKKEEGKA